ncbi:MAG: APC family permease [Thermoplasmatota archaeon]
MEAPPAEGSIAKLSGGDEGGSPTRSGAEEALPRRLGHVVATAFVVGYVVGLSGIALIFPTTPSIPWLLAILALGGVYTAAGSLIYAELSTRVPRAGGEYAYVERAFGPRWGFFRAWAAFAVVLPATLALFVQIDVQFLESMFGGLTPVGEKVLAILLLTLGLWVNLFGVKLSGRVITTWGAVKVATIVVLAGGAVWLLAMGRTAPDAWAAPTGVPGGFDALALVVAAVPFALLLYDGSYDVVALAEDMREPRRTLPFALFWGLAVSFVLFAIMGTSVLLVGGYSRTSGNVLAVFQALGVVYGPSVQQVVLVAYFLVAFGGTTAILLAASRYAFGAARDGHFLPVFGRLAGERRTPIPALALVYACAVGYTLMAGINGLISFYAGALGVLSLLAIAALLVLRRRNLGAADHFRAPGGTWLPVAWGGVTLLVVAASSIDAAVQIGPAASVGLFVLLGTAFPVFALSRRASGHRPMRPALATASGDHPSPDATPDGRTAGEA